MSELELTNLTIKNYQGRLKNLADQERSMVKELKHLWEKHRELTSGVTDVSEESTAL